MTLTVQFNALDFRTSTLRNFKLCDEEIMQKKIFILSDLISFIRKQFNITDTDIFLEDDVAEGILCTINDIDYEITGLANSPIKSGDKIDFIITLHGG